MAGPLPSILSVDVEDWFHVLDVPGAPALDTWAALPSRVEANFHKLLDLFAASGARGTCFFLGWVAERFPHLVKAAAEHGHEIASHGYAHRLAFELTREQFVEDARRARLILEDIAGAPVEGYRSAGFSVNESTPWFFEGLLEAGYRYDSSVFPAAREHGGMASAARAPHRMAVNGGTLVEFPITVADLLGRALCFFGGGYLRIFPLPLITAMADKVLREGRPVVFYIHPREIDPTHPRMAMGLRRRFKSYVNLRTTEPKLRALLARFPVTSFRDFQARFPAAIGAIS